MYQVSSQKAIVSAMLHPQVKLALAYLDCHLEDELLRYRRARSGSQVTPSSARAMRSSGKAKVPVELTQFIAIDALPKKAIDSDLSGQTNTVLPEEMLSGLAVTSDNDSSDSQSSFSSEDEYSLDDLMANSGVEILGDRSLYIPDHLPNDYLESSEELLRTLAQEEAGAEQERSSIEGLLTPLGIGSMMLMLIGSGMFGYLVMNPSTFTAIGSAASRIVNGVKLPSAPSVTAPAAVAVNGEVPTDSNEFVDLSLNNLVVMGTQGKGSGLLKMPAPIAPNATGNPLGLVAVTGNKAGAPIAIPGSLSQPTPQSNGAANPAQQGTSQPGTTPPIAVQTPARPSLYRPVQPQKPAPAYRAPVKTVPVQLPPTPPLSSTPTAIPSAQSEAPIAPATGGYRVEIPYTGDTALEKAQKSDAGAYFKNGENGAVIQMGESYPSREAAEAKAQQLKQQGFDGVEVQK